MAFKKTQGQRTGVSPTGTPNLSGYKALANSYDQLAQAAYGIGSDIRQQNLNDLIIEAEADGRTAGATYDDKGQLVPLTNLDWGRAAEGIGRKEQQALNESFRKNAVQTYAQTIGLDANRAATEALLNSPDDPVKVLGSMSGYLQSLQDDLPEDVYSAILPKVTSEFVVAENKAKAQRLINSRANSIDVATRSIELNNEKLAVHFSKGSSDNPAYAVGQQQIIKELQEENEASYELMLQNGATEESIQTLRDKGLLLITSKTSVAAAERAYHAEGIAGAYNFALQTRMELSEDETIDGDSVFSSMVSHLTSLEQGKNLQKKATTEKQSSLANKVAIDIFNGDITDLSQIDAMKDELGIGNLQNLRGMFINKINYDQSVVNAEEKKIKDQNEEIYQSKLNMLDFGSYSEFVESAQSLNDMYINGSIDAKQRGVALGKIAARSAAIQKQGGSMAVAQLKIEMGETGGFLLSPQHYINMEQDLRDKGIIGEEKGSLISGKEWGGMVNSYTVGWKKNVERQEVAISAMRKVRGGLTLNKAEIDYMRKQAPSTVTDINGNDVPLDILSQDPFVREQSIKTVAGYFVNTNVLSELGLDLLSDIEGVTDQNYFDTAMQLFSSIVKSYPDIKGGDLGALSALESQGVDIATLDIGRLAGMNAIMDMKNSRSSTTRNLNSININQMSDDEFFKKTFEEAVQDDSILNFVGRTMFGLNMVPYNGPTGEFRSMLDQIKSQSGVSTITGAVFADQRIMNIIKQTAENEFARGNVTNDKQGYKVAILKGISTLFGDIGLEKKADGSVVWALHPILREANSTTGARPIEVSYDMIMEDIQSVVLSTPAASSSDFSDAIANKQFEVEVNTVYGKEPDYTVFVVQNGKRTRVLNSYRYNFETSIHNEDYNNALNKIENSRVKKFWKALPGMDSIVVSQSFKNYAQNRNVDSLLVDLARAYNNAGFAPIDLNEFQSSMDETMQLLDTVLTFGVR